MATAEEQVQAQLDDEEALRRIRERLLNPPPSDLARQAPPTTAGAKLTAPPQKVDNKAALKNIRRSLDATTKENESALSKIGRSISRTQEDRELAVRSEEAGRARSLLGAFTGGIGGVVGGVPEGLESLVTAPFEAAFGDLDTPPEDRPGRRLGDFIKRGFQGPVNPDYAEDFTTHLAQGAGSLVGFVAGALVGRGAGLFNGARVATAKGLAPEAAAALVSKYGVQGGRAAAGIIGSLTVGAETIQDAERNKAEAGDRFTAFLGGMALGATEMLTMGAVLNRLDKGSGGFVDKWIQDSFAANVLVQGTSGAIEEGIQEFIQNAGTNAIAKALFDADREIIDAGVIEGTEIGGILGFTMSALMTALGGRHARRAVGALDIPPTGPAGRAEAAASGASPPGRPAEEAVSLDTLSGAEPAPGEPLTAEQQTQLDVEAEAAATAEEAAPAALKQRRDSLKASLEQITDPSARVAVQAELRRVETEISGGKPTRRTRKENAILARTPLLDDTADIVIRKLGGLDTDIENDFAGKLKDTPLSGRKNILGINVKDIESPGSGVTLDTITETFHELGFIAEKDQALAAAIIDRIIEGEAVRNPRSGATEVELEAEAKQRELDFAEQATDQGEEGEAQSIEQLTTRLAELDESLAEDISKRELPDDQAAAVLRDNIQRLEGEQGVEPTGEPETGAEPAGVAEAERESIGAEPEADAAAAGTGELEPATGQEPDAGEPAAAEAAVEPDASGFLPGPEEGSRFKVEKVGATGGILLSKRNAEGTPNDFYVGADGILIPADQIAVNRKEDLDRLFKPASAEQEQAVKSILEQMGPLDLGDPKRKELRQQLVDVVTGQVPPGGGGAAEAAVEPDGRLQSSLHKLAVSSDGVAITNDQGEQVTEGERLLKKIQSRSDKLTSVGQKKSAALSELFSNKWTLGNSFESARQTMRLALLEGNNEIYEAALYKAERSDRITDAEIEFLQAAKTEKDLSTKVDAEEEVEPEALTEEQQAALDEARTLPIHIPLAKNKQGQHVEIKGITDARMSRIQENLAKEPNLLRSTSFDSTRFNLRVDHEFTINFLAITLEDKKQLVLDSVDRHPPDTATSFNIPSQPESKLPSHITEALIRLDRMLQATPRALAEKQTIMEQRQAEDEAKAVFNASTDARKSILDSPATVKKLTGLSLDDFTDKASRMIKKYILDEQAEAASTGDDIRLKGLNTIADTDSFFDDLFYSALRVAVEKKSDFDKRDQKKNQKADREHGKKFGTTGVRLRRWWQQKSDLAKDADSSNVERFIKDLSKATVRADLFPVEVMAKGGTPGLRRYLEYLRGRIRPYKEWASHTGTHFFGFQSFDENISEIVSDDEKIKATKDEAVQYIKTVTDFASIFEGATTIAEASDLMVRALGTDPETQTELGDRVKALGGKSRFMQNQTAQTDFHRTAVFYVTRLVEEENKPDAEVKGTRATAIVRKRVAVDELLRENRPDVLKGKDLEPAEMRETFNFGWLDGKADPVTFGDDVKSSEQRAHLNASFEAFHDLADVLNISPTAIGHGQRLYYSIGALGQGGRHSAHFAPGQPDPLNQGVVQAINLTNKGGNGSVAHEWMHSLDFYLGQTKEGERLIDEIKLQLAVNYDINQIDEHITQTLNNLLDGQSYYSGMKRKGGEANAKQYLDYTIRGLKFGTGLHIRKTDFSTEARRAGNHQYWNDPKELLARAFESWVFDEIDAEGGVSEYLVNDWVSDGKVTNPPYRFSPYPKENERARFAQLFEILRDGLEVDKNGRLSVKKGTASKAKAIRDPYINRLTAISDDLPGYMDQRKAEAADKNRQQQLEERRKRDEEAAATEAAIQDALGGETRDLSNIKMDEIHTLTDQEFQDLLDLADAQAREEQEDQHWENDHAGDRPDQQEISEDITGDPDNILAGTDKLNIELEKLWNSIDSMNNPEFFKLADEAFGGTRGEGVYTTKDAYDAMELSLNLFIREQFEVGIHQYDNPSRALDILNEMTEAAPTQANRSEEQINFQQFSTPPPLAFMAAWVANIKTTDQVLEPSAGTGSLVIHAQASGASVIANELNLRRNTLLAKLGITPRSEDAEFINAHIKENERPSVVLMNPPFSASPQTGAKNQTKRGAKHVENALKSLRPGGRLVAIVGKGMERGKPAFNKWWKKIDGQYNVRAAVRIKGNIYRKFGTSFDSVLLVIDKPTTTEGPFTTAGDVVTNHPAGTGIDNLRDLIAPLKGIRNGRLQISEPTPGQQTIEDGDIEDGDTGGERTSTLDPTGGPDVEGQSTRAGGTGTGQQTKGQAGSTGRGGDTGTADDVSGAGRPGAVDQRGGVETDQGSDTEGPSADTSTAPTDSGPGRNVSVGDLAKEIAKDGVTMADETLKGLIELFGGTSLKSFPAGFDEEAWKKSRVHFVKAVEAYERIGLNFVEMFRRMYKVFGSGTKAYFDVYGQERRAEDNNTRVNQPDIDANTADGMINSPTKEEAGQVKPKKPDQLTDDKYEVWDATNTMPDAKPHPAEIVETASMKVLDLPPTDYRPVGLDDLIEKGILSDVQLEPIIHAGDTHSRTMTAEDRNDPDIRRGILIGDGTGLGKTRELLGIILDNMNQGRKKAIYITKNQGLIEKVAKDMEVMGFDPKLLIRGHKIGVTEAITAESGILMTTYATIGTSLLESKRGAATEFNKGREVIERDTGKRGKVTSPPTNKKPTLNVKFDGEAKVRKDIAPQLLQAVGEKIEQRSRNEQFLEWAGRDFDGVLIFDEAHLMASAIETKKGRGTKQVSGTAMAGMDLAATMPDARVVYATATVASEVNQLAYLERLGLWGRGTPYETKRKFIDAYEGFGLSGMEQLARDMKQLGVGLARKISYKGVTNERLTHQISDEQTEIYDEIVRAWQAILNNFETASGDNITGAGNNRVTRERINNAVWGFQQRFFKNILLTLKMPTVIAHADEKLANGESVVIQLSLTDEMPRNKAVARGLAEGLEFVDIDLSQKGQLIQLVKRYFPVAQHVENVDRDTGKTFWTVVRDSEGKTVENPEAVRMREQLIQNLQDIRIPSGALDMFIQHWGHEKVSEFSGREHQVIINKAGEQELIRKPNNQVMLDKFQDDETQILIFSPAGNTGMDAHADLDRKNQRKRNHYVFDPGWEAKNAMQGIGRDHRSNQKQPPHVILTESNVKAEGRFMSSIAKRLDQLGSLSAGSRETGGGGLFKAEDNLENQYGERAIKDLFFAILQGRMPNITEDDVKREMGLDNLRDETTREINDDKLPHVTKFMNRLLATTIERQNLYFDRFFELLTIRIEEAVENGSYDTGLQNVMAESLEVVHEEVVYTDERTKAETKYIKLLLSDPIIYRTFQDVVEMGVTTGRALVFFARNKRSKKIYAFFDAPDKQEAGGVPTTRFRRAGTNRLLFSFADHGSLVDTNDVRTEDVKFGRKANYDRLEVADAKEAWAKQIEESPTHHTWYRHMITGLIHPINDRLVGFGFMSRMLTNDGETLIGRDVELSDVKTTLDNLQAAGAKINVTPKKMIERILENNFRYKLSNGWFLQPDIINGERRVRLKGPHAFGRIGNQLKSDGLFTEVVNSETRFYVPSKANVATTVINRLLEDRDIVDEIANDADILEERNEGIYQMREDGNAETRAMGTDLLAINANAAAAPKQRSPVIETLATAINIELIQDQTTSLIGKQVNTVEDLATLAQVYRDPRYETLRYFLTNDDGKVLYQTAVSARMPGAVGTFAVGQNVSDLGADIRKTTGAKHLWMVHNHPSGDSGPSTADIESTREIAQELRELGINVTLDHVVINSNEYSTIQTIPQGDKTRVMTKVSIKRHFGEDLLLQPAMPHPTLGKAMTGPADVADVAMAVHKGAGWITVVGTAAGGKVRAIGEVHESILTNDKLLKKQLRQFAQSTGAKNLYIIGVNPDRMFKKNTGRYHPFNKKASDWARNLVELGFVKDIISVDRQALRFRDESVTLPIHVNFGQELSEATKVLREKEGEYESEVTKQQEKIVEKVRKGQPLDRIMRGMFSFALSPFGVFGDVLNEKGEFKLGVTALNRVKRFLTSATFSDATPFRFMNGYLEHARMGLIDRYGVPEEFIQRGFEATAQQRKLLSEGLEFINRLFEAGVTSLQEAVVIQKMLTGVDLDGNEAIISTKEWEGLAGEIRAAVDALGMEAINLGLISRESYERNKGTYLHRVYTEHELGKGETLSRFMGRLMAGKKHAIKGEAMKGRGIFQEVTQERLLKDISKPDTEEFFGIKKRKGKPDESLLTKRFRILDLFDEGASPGNQTLPGIEDTPTPKKIKKRLIIPADADIPARLSNYEDRGVYEIRRIVGNKLVLWRDFTKAERVQMGEILDARYTIAKTYHVLAQDLVSARFFKDIATNPEWTWQGDSVPPDEVVAKAGTALRHYVGFEWVQVPTDPIPKTGGKERWGALAGRYVRAEIWKDLNELDAMNTKGPWQALLKQWKLNKTARHPVVHMNNVISNLTLMDIIDVRARDLWRGIKEYNDRGDLYKLARDHGAFGASYIDQEIKNEILTPILKDMSKEAKAGLYEEGSFLKKLMFVNQYSRMASEGIQRLGKAIGNFDRASIEWYRTEDEVFRMATFIRKIEQGEDPHNAAALAREQFLNYDIRAPWVNTARRSVLPFIAYTYRAVPAIADAMIRRPWKFAKYALLAEMANALAYAVSDGDEEWERASLRPETQGSVWVGGAPRMMRMPVNDKEGNPIFLDIRRWIPAGDVFDVAPNNPLPIPSWLHFGGPVMIVAEMLLNRSAFTGQDIVDPNIDTLGDKTKKYGEFMYRSFVPSAPWVPDSWYWDKIGRAISGGRDQLGRDYSLPAALLSSAGIKAVGHDVELNFDYRRREFDKTERALKYALKLNRRDLVRELINPNEARKIETDLLEKMERLNENRRKTFAPAARRQSQ